MSVPGLRRPAGGPTRLVVVGDVLLDCDVEGTADRLAPDAPVPVVERHGERWRPGGAGHAAALLARRPGVEVTLVTAIGAGDAGGRVRAMLADAGVTVLELDADGTTPEKVRVVVEGRPVVRLDRGGATVHGPVTDAMLVACADADGVLVADYGGGVVDPSRLAFLLIAAGPVPVVWDPHPRGCSPADGTWLATPNLREATAAAGLARGGRHGDVVAASSCAAALRQRWATRAVAVTIGAAGAVLATSDGAPMVVPAPAVPPGDACGAGDCFAGSAALALARGAVLSESVQQAVQEATSYVAGGAPAGEARGAAPRGGGQPVVVATSGCFDLLHAGHVGMLEDARRLGDRLVVCLNSDASVRRLKGPGRPVLPATDRAAVLRALRCVDEVVEFDEDTPVPALERIRPDLFVKGGDYFESHHPEADALARWGGRAVVVPYRAGRSTTRLIEEVRHG